MAKMRFAGEKYPLDVSVGRVFRFRDGELCLLARVGQNDEGGTLVVLIDLKTGNRWTDPAPVQNQFLLTREEWVKVATPTYSDSFTILDGTLEFKEKA